MQSRVSGRATVLLLAATGLATTVPTAWAAGSAAPSVPPSPSVPDQAAPTPSGSASGTASVAPSAKAVAGPTKDVDYRGYHVQVPKDWPVVDLAKAPRTCVRLDVSAVYLGTPGADQDCPAHPLPGKADGLLIEPAATVPGAPAPATVLPGAAVPQAVKTDGASSHQIHARLRGTGLQVTATYGKSTDTVDQILASANVDASARPSTVQAAFQAQTISQATYASTTTGPRTDAVGNAFDTCTAPSADRMHAWRGPRRTPRSVCTSAGPNRPARSPT